LALLAPDHGYSRRVKADAVCLGWLRRRWEVVFWVFRKRFLREGIFWVGGVGLFSIFGKRFFR
jgi:hypothetical protein